MFTGNVSDSDWHRLEIAARERDLQFRLRGLRQDQRCRSSAAEESAAMERGYGQVRRLDQHVALLAVCALRLPEREERSAERNGGNFSMATLTTDRSDRASR